MRQGRGLRASFAYPGFVPLFAGASVSTLADTILLVALSMWVKSLTGSNGLAGLTFFFLLVPALLAPVLGMWVDRVRRRRLLVLGHLGAAIALTPLLLVRSADEVWVIWAVAVLYGLAFVILPSGFRGLVKLLVPGEALVGANAAIQTTKEACRLGGPLLGAGLFGLAGGRVVSVAAIWLYLGASALIARVPVEEEVPQADPERFGPQLTAGVRHLARDRILSHVAVGIGLMLLVIGLVEASLYALLDAFGKPVAYAGVLLACQGAGALLGGPVAHALARRTGEIATVVAGLSVLAAGLGMVAASRHLALTLLAMGVVGLGFPVMLVAFNTLVQLRTPNAVVGRVSLAVELLVATPQAVSIAVGAVLVSFVDYRLLFMLMGVVTALGAGHVAWWLRRDIRAHPAALPEVAAPPGEATEAA